MSTALELSKKYKTLLDRNQVNTPLRLAHFFAQIDHESGLKPISENLNYSAEGLISIFKSDFDTNKDRVISEIEKKVATLLARKPQQIANFVYADQNGNGDVNSGDGWKYRGRGFIQITGRDNYQNLTRATGVNYVSNPDLLLNEADSMIAALWYWNKTNLNRYADQDNVDAISDLINLGRVTAKVGDSNGFLDRKNKLVKYKQIFKN